MALYYQGDLQALQHIEGIAVGTQANGYALLYHLQHRRAAYGISHVGFGIVAYHCACLPDNVHLGGIHVYTVAQHGLGTEYAVVQQAVHASGAVIVGGIVNVVHALGHVYMESGHAVVFLYHFLKGPVGYGEEGVAAEHCAYHGVLLPGAVAYEVAILPDGQVALLLPIPVADLIAEAGADAQLLGYFLNGEKAAGYFAEAGVMVEQSSAACLYAVYEGGVCAVAGPFQIQIAVYGPPHAVQYLIEVGGVIALYRETAGKGGIDMGMHVYECGHYYVAFSVYELRIGVLCL